MHGGAWAFLLIVWFQSFPFSDAAPRANNPGIACHPDCIKKGNCNIERGTCECAFGFAGPACEVALLSSCQASATDLPFPWPFYPKNCECYKQAYTFFECASGCAPQRLNGGDVRCYTFKDRALGQQWSAFPENASAADVMWQAGRITEEGLTLKEVPAREGALTVDLWHRTDTAFPPSQCPSRCSERGVCIRSGPPESDDRRCECEKGFAGVACEEETDEYCANRCSKRGRCSQGFCHCTPPWFGAGCTRSLAFPPRPNATTSRTQLRIYMYELPTNIAFPIALDDNLPDHTLAYMAYMSFRDEFVTDEVVRTEDPSEANLFYVPAQVYAYSSNVGSMEAHVQNVIRYISSAYPYWDKHQGRDHFIFTPADRGSCYEPEESHTMIKLTHFGYHAATVPHGGDTHAIQPEPTDAQDGCFNPQRDVVVPPLHESGLEGAAPIYSQVLKNKGVDPRRTTLLLFSGSIREGDPTYSGGSRQAILHLFESLRNSPSVRDVIYAEGQVASYQDKMHTSKFCFAPSGYGYGMRLSTAMLNGCIPVVIQDHIVQPFEGELHYHEFSVRLGHADIPNILPILRAISDAECAHLRLGMARHWKHFVWGPTGAAYDTTIRALRRRASNMWAELYH
ncbi:MAG: hypothetical protein WDW36_001199 [Sanguina aurantia]